MPELAATMNGPLPRLYTSNPSETTDDWFVWDMYEPLPPKPVFVGAMEDASLVADALNQREREK